MTFAMIFLYGSNSSQMFRCAIWPEQVPKGVSYSYCKRRMLDITNAYLLFQMMKVPQLWEAKSALRYDLHTTKNIYVDKYPKKKERQ
jgi:hypothetical protein